MIGGLSDRGAEDHGENGNGGREPDSGGRRGKVGGNDLALLFIHLGVSIDGMDGLMDGWLDGCAII